MKEQLTSVVHLATTYLLDVWILNVAMFILLMLMVVLNTRTGIRLAKKKGTYKDEVLKTTVIEKLRNYSTAITGITLFMLILKLASTQLNVTDHLNNSVLGFPGVLLQVFLAIMEYRSYLNNMKSMDIALPEILEKLPDKIADAFEKK